MILGASYNFFNGEEHLAASIAAIRESVEHISIVYQMTSNKGTPISDEAIELLHRLLADKMVDVLHCYTPDLSKRPCENETAKRWIGIDIARKTGMTHFMTIDADEFYRRSEFEFAKNFIEKNDILATTVHSFMHIKTPNWRVLDTTLVPFIFKLTPKIRLRRKYFVRHVDPTRKFVPFVPFFKRPIIKQHYLFSSDQIAMYHMNLVRKDKLISKLRNSSTENANFFLNLAKEFNSWEEGSPFQFPGKGVMNPVFVENEFLTWSPENSTCRDS